MAHPSQARTLDAPLARAGRRRADESTPPALKTSLVKCWWDEDAGKMVFVPRYYTKRTNDSDDWKRPGRVPSGRENMRAGCTRPPALCRRRHKKTKVSSPLVVETTKSLPIGTANPLVDILAHVPFAVASWCHTDAQELDHVHEDELDSNGVTREESEHAVYPAPGSILNQVQELD